MEVLSKGIHRTLVPLESHLENIPGVELAESSSGYRMLTQMDVLRFLKTHGSEIKNIISRSVRDSGAVIQDVFAVTNRTTVIETIKCMRMATLNAVPIIQTLGLVGEDHRDLINGKNRKVIGTFSATDLRGCPISLLQSWLHMSVLEFTERVSKVPINTDGELGKASRELVTCHSDSSLAEVMDKAVDHHVHRVWVVDQHGLLEGIVSLTDIIRVIRASLMPEP